MPGAGTRATHCPASPTSQTCRGVETNPSRTHGQQPGQEPPPGHGSHSQDTCLALPVSEMVTLPQEAFRRWTVLFLRHSVPYAHRGSNASVVPQEGTPPLTSLDSASRRQTVVLWSASIKMSSCLPSVGRAARRQGWGVDRRGRGDGGNCLENRNVLPALTRPRAKPTRQQVLMRFAAPSTEPHPPPHTARGRAA